VSEKRGIEHIRIALFMGWSEERDPYWIRVRSAPLVGGQVAPFSGTQIGLHSVGCSPRWWTPGAPAVRNEDVMLAIAAAVLFGLALLFELAGLGLGPVITTGTLTTAGLLCVALHLAGVATDRKVLRRRRRR
jgi:hypothetical protein